jgi:hypothetical protein
MISFIVSTQALAQNENGSRKAVLSDSKRLEGRWQRPDGGYILEIKEIEQNGTMKAAYYNPRPINVFQAKWKRTQGIMTVFVELRDFNYPGSKYDLQYDPKTDRLRGTYFQAVHGETYAVEFLRE